MKPGQECALTKPSGEAGLPHSLFKNYATEELEEALNSGIQYLRHANVPIKQTANGSDLVGKIITESILDALAVGRGDLPIRCSLSEEIMSKDDFNNLYSERFTKNGRRYFVKKDGKIPLLLITSSGIPLRVWSKFLMDRFHNFRIIIGESQSGSMLDGGMQEYSDLTTDAEDFSAVLHNESVEQSHILAWCNGGRTALEIARLNAEKISGILLLATTFRNSPGVDHYPSKFEEQLQYIHEDIKRNPAVGDYVFSLLAEHKPTRWDLFQDHPQKRASALFELPNVELSKDFRVPISNSISFHNCMKRVHFDEQYPISNLLSDFNGSIMLITGDNDAAISVNCTRSAIRLMGKRTFHASIRGGGHHVFDLQYPYFSYLLECFAKKEMPTASARIDTEWIN